MSDVVFSEFPVIVSEKNKPTLSDVTHGDEDSYS